MALRCCPISAGMEEGEKHHCGDCKTWEEELYWNRFQSFNFCQILASLPEFRTHLVIPKKFAINARALLPVSVTLRGPSLASWRADITKTGDDTFLTGGWEEFVRAYSLQASHILIFKFDGVSSFDVQIYDGETMCEKESAYFVKKCVHEKQAENPRKRASTEDGIEEHSDGLIHRATKQAREEAVNETRNSSKRPFYSRTKRIKHGRKPLSSKASPRKRTPLNKAINMNIHSGEQGQSSVQTEPTNNNPLNADTNVPPSNRSLSTETPGQGTPYINDGNLTEPSTLSSQQRQQTIGKSSSENSPRGRGRPRKTSSLASGRTIRTKTPSRKIASPVGRPRKLLSVNQAEDDVDPESPKSSRFYMPEEAKLALKMAQEQMKEDSCIAVMRSTAVCKRYIVTFPTAWCKKHLTHKNQDLFIRIGDKTFLTRLSYSVVKVAGQISSGWKRVVEANKLKLYDVCLFDIASRNDDALMLDVTVFRAGLQNTPVEPVEPVEPVDERAISPNTHNEDDVC